MTKSVADLATNLVKIDTEFVTLTSEENLRHEMVHLTMHYTLNEKISPWKPFSETQTQTQTQTQTERPKRVFKGRGG
jgi:hypothetical protein